MTEKSKAHCPCLCATLDSTHLYYYIHHTVLQIINLQFLLLSEIVNFLKGETVLIIHVSPHKVDTH